MSATDRRISQRGMGYGLRALSRIAGSPALERVGLSGGFERVVYRSTKGGLKTATRAGRTFRAAQRLTRPARPARSAPSDLFDLAPENEQKLFQETMREYAAERIRPLAAAADSACETPADVLEEISGLGVNTLGVPEDLGGVPIEQPTVTSVLVAEALAHGDMGIAYAALAPGAVATALGRWGNAEQQDWYLSPFAGEDPPVGALAILEPRPLFDPLELATTAHREGGDWILDGAKALVARPHECELFVVAARAAGIGPALFLVESSSNGLSVEREPSMGLRAAATGRLILDGVRAPAGALMAESAGESYSECLHRARIAWAALAAGAVTGGAGPCDPVRQGTLGVRRADLQPPGRRLHGLRHCDRERRNAARDIPGREPR